MVLEGGAHGVTEPLLRHPPKSNSQHGGARLADFESAPSVEADMDEALADLAPLTHSGASLAQATFNVLNIFMGIGLLSMAFAMRLSGWVGLAVLGATTALFCVSGKLIVRAFDRIPAGMLHTYPNLGAAALGPWGRYLVAGFALSEFFGGSCIMIVVIWQELAAFLPAEGVGSLSAFHLSVLAGLAALAPLLLIPSFRRLSFLSILGFVSTVVVTATIVTAVCLDPHRARMPVQPPPGHTLARLGIFQAVGIFAVSVSGHSSLPVMRSSMARPAQFDTVLNLAFAAMLAVYGTCCGLGYYYFGDSASPLITADLAANSVFSGRSLLVPGLTVDRLVGACITANAYTTYPLLLLVMQDMLLSVLPGADARGTHRPPRAAVGVALRLAIFAAGAVLSYMAYSVLGDAISLVGGACSMTCSLLLPALFYARLAWKELGLAQRTALAALLAAAPALVALVVACNLADLARRWHPPSSHAAPGNGLEALGGLLPLRTQLWP